jgi:formylglycine-generating enzyme required for sulfatase activity
MSQRIDEARQRMIRQGRRNLNGLCGAVVKRNLCAATVAVIVSLITLGLPLLLTPSAVLSSQVGPKAPPPETRPPSERAGAAKRNTNKPKPQEPKGTLIFYTDMDCRISLDGKELGALDEGQQKTVSTKFGPHSIEARSALGNYIWTEVIEVTTSRRQSISIEFKRKKAEAEETARLEGEKQQADAEARRRKIITDRAKKDGFVIIPAGEFMMGSENGDVDEKPVHRVRISRPFEMGKCEVTQAFWEALAGNNPSTFKGANLPVEHVSWDDVQEFIEKLNARNDGYLYRLPTEAEWEYACRAGSFEDYAGDLNAMAWYRITSDERSHPVGQKYPNAWGLYDMHGNVWEWCQDWYDRNFYAQTPSLDPQGPVSGSLRVVRGGGWFYDAWGVRSAIRSGSVPAGSGQDLGFRLVRTSR